MSLLFFLFLVAAPGALAAFSPAGAGMRWSTRFWIGVALSPFVVALLLLSLKALGVPYATAVNLVLVPCLAGLLLGVRALPRVPPARAAVVGPMCAAAVVAAMGAVLWRCWLDHPVTQYTAWHALHHTDISYATTNPGVVPRDPSLAGSLIRYPFLAHYYWGWLGTLLDRPPNLVYRWTNTAWLFATAALVYAFARKLAIRPVFCALAVVLMLSGNNLVAAIEDVVQGGFFASARIGDVRYTLFLQKFYSFNIVPFGLGLAAAWMTLGAQMVTGTHRRAHGLLFTLVLAAAGTMYPLLFPALWIGAVGVVAILTTPLLGDRPQVRGRDAWALLVGLAIATAISAGYLLFCLSGRAAPAVPWEWQRVLEKIRFTAVSLGPLLVLAVPSLLRGHRERDPGIAICLPLLAASIGFYVLVPVASGNEYKTIFLATMVLAVLAANSANGLRPIRDGWICAGIVALAVPLVWINYERLGLLSPRRFGIERPALVLDSFSLALAPRDRHSEWTAAVRTGTPPETVVLAPPQIFPASVVTRRDLYVPRNRYWLGYEVAPRTMLVDVRGADPETYDRRLQVHRAIYGTNVRSYATALAELEKLGRPVAIRFDVGRHPFLDWIARQRLGVLLPIERKGTVLYLDFDSPPRAGGAPARRAEP